MLKRTVRSGFPLMHEKTEHDGLMMGKDSPRFNLLVRNRFHKIEKLTLVNIALCVSAVGERGRNA
jgi:hypothetical protein